MCNIIVCIITLSVQDDTLHTQRVSNYYTLYSQFFAFNLEKNYTRQKKFTQAPPVVPVTNMRYVDTITKDVATITKEVATITKLF